MILETQPQTLHDLFRQFASFQVPAYQRAFAWEHKHVEQFIQDLREQPPQKPYYLGHFLLERMNNDMVYVVDGQQRLTTLDADKKPILDRSTYNAHREIAAMMGAQGEWTESKIQ